MLKNSRIRKIKEILFVTVGNINHASSRTRVFEYRDYFNAKGIVASYVCRKRVFANKWLTVGVNFFLKRNFNLRLWMRLKRLPSSQSVVFCQKEVLTDEMLEFLKNKEIRVYYDIDDAIFLEHNNNEERRHFKRFLDNVEHIFVSTRYLKDQMTFGGTSSILPTPVKMRPEIWHRKTGQKPYVFGWIGSPSTEDNLELIIPIFEELSYDYDFKVILLGVANPHRYSMYKWCNAVKWILRREVEFLELMDYGLAPLKNNTWNQGKGGYKINLYMSAGIPVLTSPVGINKDLVQPNLNGERCGTTEEWRKSLKHLLNSEPDYFSLSQSAFNECKRSYSYDACFDQMWKVLTKK